MAKTVKLTDEEYSKLKYYAKADGLTLAGEIRQIIELRRAVNMADVLMSLADKMKAKIDDNRSIINGGR